MRDEMAGRALVIAILAAAGGIDTLGEAIDGDPWSYTWAGCLFAVGARFLWAFRTERRGGNGP